MTQSRPLPATPGWFATVRPREHGSWSLALEPLVLGLAVAPSAPGLALAVATLGGFFARRPLRLWWEGGAESATAGQALLPCVLAALSALGFALALAGGAWVAWLLPPAALGAVFLQHDLRRDSRSAAAEIAGAAAFAFLPAVLARLAGFPPAGALALAAVCAARHLPTVLFVRARVRAQKAAAVSPVPALLAAGAAGFGSIALVRAGLAPASAAGLAGLLLARAAFLLGPAGRHLTARTIGMIEAALGLLFVVVLAVTWPRA
jgi:hypothetical protein